MLSESIQREISNYGFGKSHGAVEQLSSLLGSSLGVGFLYYFLTCNTKARVCVCVGSGGGFVPALMRQAQIDHMIVNSKTILIDANITAPNLIKEWGNDYVEVPIWIDKPDDAFSRRYIAVIETIIKTSDDAVFDMTEPIDYLHLDGDHSYDQVKKDFHNYASLVKDGGYITLHDIHPEAPDNITGVRKFLNELRQTSEYDIFYFEPSGWSQDMGTALIKKIIGV